MKWNINEEHRGMSVRDFLRDIGGLSRRILISAKSAEGKILLNGRPVTVRERLEEGDVLEVELPPEPISKWLFPQPMDLSIVYEDDALLVIDKAAGIPVLPSPLYQSGTVANGLLAHYEKIGNPHTIHIVTRLDKDTSGLLLIAKNRLSHSLLAKSLQRDAIHRKYLAIVERELREEEGEIDAPIGRKPGSIVEREVTPDGKEALTLYKVVARLDGYTLVEVELKTGRTHQIRVHFSHLGHPLLGDDLYGGKKDLLERQALHCHQLTFFHPFTNEQVTIESELPYDMEEVVNSLSLD